MSSTLSVGYPPPPASGLNYLAVIRPSLKLLLLCSAWSSALVSLLFALFLFSSRSLKRAPIFMLNVTSIITGLTLGVLDYYSGVTAILSPDLIIPGAAVIAHSVVSALPLFTESILVVRVLTVYPLKRTPRLILAIVYIPLCFLKAARLINILIFWSVWFPTIVAGGNPIAVAQQSWDFPSDKIEWFLQIFDNGYASALFLYRLRGSRSINGRIDCTRRPATSYSKHLSALFWISVSNFVFLVMISFVQLTFAFSVHLFLDATYIIMSNIYFEIIALLLASSAGSRWSEEQQATTGLSVSVINSLPRFATGTVSAGTAAAQVSSTRGFEVFEHNSKPDMAVAIHSHTCKKYELGKDVEFEGTNA
ncbi:uncharacterized protein BT62DRAFT_533484 [Guyanagaster necrorhizus]|uniref:Uncharacterized protein n=1 Tax=Guyanagaster necrorhizus TaxID=856835 RepID=A0A9P7W008_9AGAR|nr:uncharacterized protein BT62DRAFT_533484 [Guyanagaster necrorhizus MCA 3950]KAG7450751.1 hypothetical protein BT62DRAFT_533484 [Guyanagaster necrorhizus MCA 3950]